MAGHEDTVTRGSDRGVEGGIEPGRSGCVTVHAVLLAHEEAGGVAAEHHVVGDPDRPRRSERDHAPFAANHLANRSSCSNIPRA